MEREGNGWEVVWGPFSLKKFWEKGGEKVHERTRGKDIYFCARA